MENHETTEIIRATDSEKQSGVWELTGFDLFSFRYILRGTWLFKELPEIQKIKDSFKLPVYEVDFGTGKPAIVIPHNLGDPVLIRPAPPSMGGVEVYFSGVIAHAVHKLPAKDPWLEQLKKIDVE
ncbi:MAG: hypothetical protein JXB88_02685 [Spirochaetales bacterium]|nr:hypothetical protein [Spirochaetales bacterium]